MYWRVKRLWYANKLRWWLGRDTKRTWLQVHSWKQLRYLCFAARADARANHTLHWSLGRVHKERNWLLLSLFGRPAYHCWEAALRRRGWLFRRIWRMPVWPRNGRQHVSVHLPSYQFELQRFKVRSKCAPNEFSMDGPAKEHCNLANNRVTTTKKANCF